MLERMAADHGGQWIKWLQWLVDYAAATVTV